MRNSDYEGELGAACAVIKLLSAAIILMSPLFWFQLWQSLAWLWDKFDVVIK